ncbi:MAG: tRNA (N6-threonylcarbamoyladenosine(37)-N6)-methyltransferase TrmO [Candidatus Aminicenantaceae bacterium]
MEFKFKPIGIVHSPFKKKEDIKTERFADPRGFESVEGELEIFKEYEAGLKDVEGFSHIIVLFVFHQSEGYKLHTKPFLDDKLRGVFSTRSPNRPNPVGLTVVSIKEIKGNILRVKGIDMIEGTPVLDIKPFTPRDQKSSVKYGWLEDKMEKS